MLLAETFIFIHIPKTAGTSISRALSPYVTERKLHKSRDSVLSGHITLRELRAKKELQLDKFTFAFVRNPWERMQSLYHYTIKHGKRRGPGTEPRKWHKDIPRYEDMGLNRWIIKEMNPWINRYTSWHHNRPHNKKKILQQVDWIDGEIDFVGRFETLQEDFNTVCDKINIPQSVLSHKMTTEHIHYTDEYNEKAKKKIARLFASDIKQFNYKF